MIVGPSDEEFDAFVEQERAKMLTSTSSAVVIPLKKADARAERLGGSGAAPRRLILPPSTDPMAVAREFIKSRCRYGEDLTLRYLRGGWWNWRTSHWIEVDDRTIRSELYQFTEKASYLSGKKLVPWAPTQSKISNLLAALAAVCLLPPDIDQPGWLDDRNDTRVIVAIVNGLLDVERRELLDHSPKFFNQTSVPFNYDPEAAEPKLAGLSGRAMAERAGSDRRAC
jgi:putative DNA primase/helicase